MNRFLVKVSFLLVFLGFSVALSAQKKAKDAPKENFAGTWSGLVTQEMGYRTKYQMELYLHQDGNKVTGRSYVYVDSIYAEMVVEGQVLGGKILMLKDIENVDFEIIEEMEWCIKAYQLMLKKEDDVWRLEGKWQGNTTFSKCVPGDIKLKRLVPRA